MVSKNVTIVNPSGLHARPATTFVEKAKTFKCNVSIKRTKEMRTVNGKSVIMLMAGGYKKGDEIAIVCDGEDEQVACDELVALLLSFTE